MIGPVEQISDHKNFKPKKRLPRLLSALADQSVKSSTFFILVAEFFSFSPTHTHLSMPFCSNCTMTFIATLDLL
jgi:hypothetical protein